MKKQNTPHLQAQFLRPAAFYLLLFMIVGVAVSPAVAALIQKEASLTFSDRVAYQHAIEEVYWRHRTWPKENPDPKPSLDAVISQAQLQKKVRDYLQKSGALEDYLQRPISGDELQAEMERMAKNTQQPELLRE